VKKSDIEELLELVRATKLHAVTCRDTCQVAIQTISRILELDAARNDGSAAPEQPPGPVGSDVSEWTME